MRKSVWKSRFGILWVMLAFLLLSGPVCRAGAEENQEEGVREVLNLNTDWLYSDTEYTNGEVVGLMEDSFLPVSVPHANKILDTHIGNNFLSAIRSYRFTSWYRRHFTLPDTYRGKQILLDFEGVATVADVYVNGQHLANHKGAYTGFRVDITDALYWDGKDNVLAVKVDSKRQPQVPPEGGSVDYCLFGGIVRDVSMTIVNPVYVERTFVTTPGMMTENGNYFGEDVAVTSRDTTVKNQVDIKNVTSEAKSYTVEIQVLEEDGTLRAAAEAAALIPANGEKTVTVETEELKDVHLWNLDDPYQYRMITRVKDGDRVLDTHETKFGIRKIGFKQKIQAPYNQDNAIDMDADGAFYLNGEPVKIMGINRHEQWPWIGRAVPNKLQARDADLIKASGINAVRCSHYPQDPSFLDRCDEIGLLVFEEPPGWQHIGDEEWKELFRTNLEEMILRDRNHPSIVSWGTSPNESVPEVTFNRECEAYAKELDPTRPTHGVRKREDYPYDSSKNENYEVVTDIFTPNYTYPEPPRAIPYIVAEHAFDWWDGSFPDANEADTLKYIDTFGSELDYFFRNSTVAGGFGWSMFDYNNEVNYTASEHVFRSGLYDLFRQDKPVAHLYESQWDPEAEDGPGPMVYIANKWGSSQWSDRQNRPQRIYVFSNCEEVELFLDGRSLGRKKPNKYTSLPHPIFEYEISDLPYGEGDLKAVGYIGGSQKAECERQRAGEAVRLEVSADDTTLTADGTDMTSVSIRAVDARGNLVPFADNVIQVSQTGGAGTTLIAEKEVKLEGGRLAFFVQTLRDETGTAEFLVESRGLESAACSIDITPFEAEDLVPVPDQIEPGAIKPEQSLGSQPVINDDQAGEKDYQFNYQGNWKYGSQAGAYQEDNTYSNTVGDSCTMTFTGAQIRYYGSKAPNHGVASFQIDDGPEIYVDCYAKTREENALLFDSGYLERSRKHTLTVRVTGNRHRDARDCYVNADWVEISEKRVEKDEYSIDDSSVGQGLGQFSYSGGWTVNSSTADSWTNRAGETVSFRFYGTRLRYYAARDTHHGIGAFSLDGGEEKPVDFYGEERQEEILLYDTGELEPGEHLLTIRATGEKSEASTDSYIVVEKVTITNEPRYRAKLSAPYWFETLGWTVDVENTGTAGLDADVILAAYDREGRLADQVIKDCSADSYLEVKEKRTLGANLSGEFETVRAFAWDSGTGVPLTEAMQLEGMPGITDTLQAAITTDADQSQVQVSVEGAGQSESPISLICFDPSGDGIFSDLNKNADAIVYLNQYTQEGKTTQITFQIREELQKGSYYLVLGTAGGRLIQEFSFDLEEPEKPGKPEEPEEPDHPTESEPPEKPENPGKPEDPGKPENPQKPSGARKPSVSDPAPETSLKKGQVFTAKGLRYRVTDGRKGREKVAVTGAVKKNIKTVKIPERIKYRGKSCKVTAIKAKAFANCKKLRKVTIGRNVTEIGKRAFYGDAQLKTVIVGSRQVKKVGAQTFRGIHKKAVIKLPAKGKKSYKKKFRNKGQAGSVKIK